MDFLFLTSVLPPAARRGRRGAPPPGGVPGVQGGGASLRPARLRLLAPPDGTGGRGLPGEGGGSAAPHGGQRPLRPPAADRL